MPAFGTAYLKPDYLPVLFVGSYANFYQIQHEVDPDEIVITDGVRHYRGLAVEIIGDTELGYVTEYPVPADQLVTRQDFA
jgi:hypothetical protein